MFALPQYCDATSNHNTILHYRDNNKCRLVPGSILMLSQIKITPLQKDPKQLRHKQNVKDDRKDN